MTKTDRRLLWGFAAILFTALGCWMFADYQAYERIDLGEVQIEIVRAGGSDQHPYVIWNELPKGGMYTTLYKKLVIQDLSRLHPGDIITIRNVEIHRGIWPHKMVDRRHEGMVDAIHELVKDR